MGVNLRNELKEIENCYNKHFKHFSSLYCLWKLLLAYASKESAAFLLCHYLVKSASEKCFFLLGALNAAEYGSEHQVEILQDIL